MKSIRTKFILITICEIIVVVVITGLLGIAAISDLGNTSSNQILFLLCEDGQKNLMHISKALSSRLKRFPPMLRLT